ncbi:MAG: hypothetical protein QXU01_02590 [Candidatus Hadarchaeales archaeon]
MLKNETHKIMLEMIREVSRLRSDVDLISRRLESLESRIKEIENMIQLLGDNL